MRWTLLKLSRCGCAERLSLPGIIYYLLSIIQIAIRLRRGFLLASGPPHSLSYQLKWLYANGSAQQPRLDINYNDSQSRVTCVIMVILPKIDCTWEEQSKWIREKESMPGDKRQRFYLNFLWKRRPRVPVWANQHFQLRSLVSYSKHFPMRQK